MELLQQTYKRTQIILVTVFFIVFVFTFLQEKTVNNGAGSDGLYYRELVRNFPDMLQASFSSYKASRILPFAFAYYLCRFFHISTTDQHVLLVIWSMILVLMVAGVVYYFKLAKLLNWRKDLTLLGFILLFYQFAVLKYSGNYPLLTDHFIFPLTIMVVYQFFSQQKLYLMLLGFACCFIWPTYSLFIPLLLLNNPVKSDATVLPLPRLYKTLFTLIKIGLAFVPVVLFVYLIRSQNLWIDKRYLTADRIYGQFRPSNFWVSVAATAAVYFYYLFLLWPLQWQYVVAFIKSIGQTKFKQLLPAFLFIGVVSVVKYFLTLGNTDVPYPTIQSLLVEFTFRPAVAPFNFLVFAFWFLGLLVFFCIRFYPQLLEQFFKIGNGYFLLLLYSLVFLTTAQPRFLTSMLPFFLVALMPVLEHIFVNRLSVKILAAYSLLALVVSRFWLPITINEAYTAGGTAPAEKYPMFVGPWITNQFYLLLGLIGLILFLVWNRYLLQTFKQTTKSSIDAAK